MDDEYGVGAVCCIQASMSVEKCTGFARLVHVEYVAGRIKCACVGSLALLEVLNTDSSAVVVEDGSCLR